MNKQIILLFALLAVSLVQSQSFNNYTYFVFTEHVNERCDGNLIESTYIKTGYCNQEIMYRCSDDGFAYAFTYNNSACYGEPIAVDKFGLDCLESYNYWCTNEVDAPPGTVGFYGFASSFNCSGQADFIQFQTTNTCVDKTSLDCEIDKSFTKHYLTNDCKGPHSKKSNIFYPTCTENVYPYESVINTCQ